MTRPIIAVIVGGEGAAGETALSIRNELARRFEVRLVPPTDATSADLLTRTLDGVYGLFAAFAGESACDDPSSVRIVAEAAARSGVRHVLYPRAAVPSGARGWLESSGLPLTFIETGDFGGHAIGPRALAIFLAGPPRKACVTA